MNHKEETDLRRAESAEPGFFITPELMRAMMADVFPHHAPTSDEPKPQKPKRRVDHTYVLPNGEVVTSGKGLGRGRPGIKRGPRKSQNANSPAVAQSRKRKRSDGDSAKPTLKASIVSLSDSEPLSDSESEDEYTPLSTQTRSGRQTQRPPAFVPESPTHKKPRLDPAPVTKEVNIKPKAYKGKDKNALCEHCSRGYGPPKNPIVFCDACNLCWHQKCHDPAIPRKVIVDARSEWFCRGCLDIIEQSKKRPEKPPHPTFHKPEKTTKYETEVTESSSKTDEAAIKAYYNSRDKEVLIDLLLRAQGLAPDLAIWPDRSRTAPFQALKSNTPPAKPARQIAASALPADPVPDNTEEAEDYEDLFDEHARLYPRPGYGVQLPPENEDMHMLLEGAGSKTFSHRVGGVLQRVGVAS